MHLRLKPLDRGHDAIRSQLAYPEVLLCRVIMALATKGVRALSDAVRLSVGRSVCPIFPRATTMPFWLWLL